MNVGSIEVRLVVPAGQRLELDRHLRAGEERGQLIADLGLELRRRQRLGLIGQDDPRRLLRRRFEERLDEEDRRRLQRRQHDGDENRKDEGEFDRRRAGFVVGQLSPKATDASEKFVF